MTALKKIPAHTDRSTLLVVTDQIHEPLFRRAASIATVLDSELQIYCPVVMPPAPHTGIPQNEPPWKDDLSLARSQARRIAGRVQSILNEESIDSHVETGVCRSMTEGVIEAAERLGPDLLLLPQTDEHALVDKPFHVQPREVWPASDMPVWLLNRDEPEGSNVCAVVFPDSLSGGNTAEAERVVSQSARFAGRFDTNLHIVTCVSQSPALAVAKEALAPSGHSIAQQREDRVVRRLYDLARSYAIPAPHVQLLRGNVHDEIERLLDPLEIGVVVTSGRPQRRFGGLIKRPRALDLSGLQCDLLILGESDDIYA